MNTILFISLLLLAAVIVFRFSKRLPAESETSRQLPAFQFDGLFAEQHAEEAQALAEEEARLHEEATRHRLLERAAEGEIKVLDEAHAAGDAQIYKDVLQAIYMKADGNPKVLRSIAKHILDSQELRTSSEFAEVMITLWSDSPYPYSLAKMLFLAALADDAMVFQRALDAGLKRWRAGQLEKVSAKGFLTTVEIAFFMVAEEVRISGAGFLLKQAIADVRRELAAANRRSA